ncbi:hypothetical protein GI374_15935 [Paracoccus sp. S-4012]|uniref:ceramidase domain-containing protein n=1 Tax=Paracoccus sp. S-4012 TaxID=2665648 RepID=UPI0012B0595F|nr:ceramidase domain-containing protein [Paracoccus sp. S-4012]MRX51882.1 hypothetical protein [Paracoccus sp. S-4012]
MLDLETLTRPVDIYCERTGPGFWAEPWNALSNLSFIAGGLWGWRTATARGERSAAVWTLIWLAFAIGVGSFLFHTFAQVWAVFADTIPIWAFVALGSGIAAVRIGGFRPGTVLVAFLVLIGVGAMLSASGGSSAETHEPPPLNGSLQYAPAVLALAVFAVLGYACRHPLRHWVAAALVTFLLSLTARTFDMAVCESLPTGLHWIWHLMNGLLIGLVLQIVIRAGDPVRPGLAAGRARA